MKLLFLVLVFLPSITFQYLNLPAKNLSLITTHLPFNLPILMPKPMPVTSHPIQNQQLAYLSRPRPLPIPAPLLRGNYANNGHLHTSSSNMFATNYDGSRDGYFDLDDGFGFYGGISGYGGYNNGGYGEMDHYNHGITKYVPKLSTTIMALGFLALGAQIASLIITAINNNNNNNVNNGDGNTGTLDERFKREILVFDNTNKSISVFTVNDEQEARKLKTKCRCKLRIRMKQISRSNSSEKPNIEEQRLK